MDTFLSYLIAWKGLNTKLIEKSKQPSSFKQYQKKAKNWANGARARQYSRKLYPHMIKALEKYVKQLITINTCGSDLQSLVDDNDTNNNDNDNNNNDSSGNDTIIDNSDTIEIPKYSLSDLKHEKFKKKLKAAKEDKRHRRALCLEVDRMLNPQKKLKIEDYNDEKVEFMYYHINKCEKET